MKVFFGEALDDMLREMRGQGVPMVRVHCLPEVQGQTLSVRTHVTTLCNNQIYESLLQRAVSLEKVPAEGRRDFILGVCEQEHQKVIERLSGFETRAGILQE